MTNHEADCMSPGGIVVAAKVVGLTRENLSALGIVYLIGQRQYQGADAVDPGDEYLVGVERLAYWQIAAVAIVQIQVLALQFGYQRRGARRRYDAIPVGGGERVAQQSAFLLDARRVICDKLRPAKIALKLDVEHYQARCRGLCRETAEDEAEQAESLREHASMVAPNAASWVRFHAFERQFDHPPSIMCATPVVKEDSSEARYTHSAAISSA